MYNNNNCKHLKTDCAGSRTAMFLLFIHVGKLVKNSSKSLPVQHTIFILLLTTSFCYIHQKKTCGQQYGSCIYGTWLNSAVMDIGFQDTLCKKIIKLDIQTMQAVQTWLPFDLLVSFYVLQNKDNIFVMCYFVWKSVFLINLISHGGWVDSTTLVEFWIPPKFVNKYAPKVADIS